MMAKKTRKEDATEARRAAILNAARSVFARQGYEKTVVEDIAAQAGIAKGTIYLYFSSKEQVYLAALLEAARHLDSLTRARVEAAQGWEDKLRAYVEVRLEYLGSHPDTVRICLSEFRPRMMRGVPMQCELFNAFREGEALLVQILSAAAAQGKIRDVNPEIAALAISDLTRGLVERRLMGWCSPISSSDVEFTLDLLCRALKAR